MESPSTWLGGHEHDVQRFTSQEPSYKKRIPPLPSGQIGALEASPNSNSHQCAKRVLIKMDLDPAWSCVVSLQTRKGLTHTNQIGSPELVTPRVERPGDPTTSCSCVKGGPNFSVSSGSLRASHTRVDRNRREMRPQRPRSTAASAFSFVSIGSKQFLVFS